MHILYLDCFSGISGDMAVGALRDLGVEEGVFHSAIAGLGLDEAIHTHFTRGVRQSIAGWKFEVHAHDHAADGHSEHTHGRNFREIRTLIEKSQLSDFVKGRSIAVFQRIALAEGKIHDIPAERVTFHEVGALDSIADIVSACAGIEALGVKAVLASSLVDGSGSVECGHGWLPVPVPATLEILSGIPVRQVKDAHEPITPTGRPCSQSFARPSAPCLK
jgi:pyridinium-3,5-bisthiocarboxylic acid mononucleotide nickel chelatase